MTKPCLAVLLTTIGVLLAATGCNRPAEQPQASTPAAGTAVASAFTSPVSINAAMVRIIDHAGHELWDAEREETAPKTEADWEGLVEHATRIAGAGVLIRMAGTGLADRMYVQHPERQSWSRRDRPSSVT